LDDLIPIRSEKLAELDIMNIKKKKYKKYVIVNYDFDTIKQLVNIFIRRESR